MIGLLAMGTSCLALVCVIGRRRVPAPPARMSPFIRLCVYHALAGVRGRRTGCRSTTNRWTAVICAKPRGSRRGSTRTTSAGSPSARSAPCRWSCGAGTASTRRPTSSSHMHDAAGRRRRRVLRVRALRRRQHAQHPRPLPRARAAGRRLLRARPEAHVTWNDALTEHVLTIDLGTSGPKVAIVHGRRHVRRRRQRTRRAAAHRRRRRAATPDDWWQAISRRRAARRRTRRRAAGVVRRGLGDVAVVGNGADRRATASCCTTRSSGWTRAAPTCDPAARRRPRSACRATTRASCAAGSDSPAARRRDRARIRSRTSSGCRNTSPRSRARRGSTSSRRTG